MLTDNRALDDPVASVLGNLKRPIRADGGMARVTWIVAAPRRTRDVRPFEPCGVGQPAGRDVRVHLPQTLQHLLRKRIRRHCQEIDIARCGIEVSQRE
jgi:hypothetical protein